MKSDLRKIFDSILSFHNSDLKYPNSEVSTETFVVSRSIGSSVHVLGYFDTQRDALAKACDYIMEFKRPCRVTRVKFTVQSF